MGLRINRKGTGNIVEGRYPAIIIGAKSRKTRFGGALLFEFELKDEQHDGVRIDGMFPPDATERNKTGRLLANCGVGFNDDTGIEIAEIEGREITIVVGKREGKKYVFPCVKDTLPPF